MQTKAEKYEALLPRAQALLSGEKDMIAGMANLAALLHYEFGFWWTGFYRVEQFPGHIACSSESRSEIVVPLRRSGRIIAVLDIDSRELATFDEADALWLEKILQDGLLG